MERLRPQFETNVFGLVRMCQLVLPGMRGAGRGRIVNISSMGGKLTFPGGGVYHATKHAVEALSDALRFEVSGFGVHVVIIEPGLIKTSSARPPPARSSTPRDEARSTTPTGTSTPPSARRRPAPTRDRWRGSAAGPETVATDDRAGDHLAAAEAALQGEASARLVLAQRRLLTDRAWDAFMRTQFPTPR